MYCTNTPCHESGQGVEAREPEHVEIAEKLVQMGGRTVGGGG